MVLRGAALDDNHTGNDRLALAAEVEVCAGEFFWSDWLLDGVPLEPPFANPALK